MFYYVIAFESNIPWALKNLVGIWDHLQINICFHFLLIRFWASASILPDHGPRLSTLGTLEADGGVPEAGRLPMAPATAEPDQNELHNAQSHVKSKCWFDMVLPWLVLIIVSLKGSFGFFSSKRGVIHLVLNCFQSLTSWIKLPSNFPCDLSYTFSFDWLYAHYACQHESAHTGNWHGISCSLCQGWSWSPWNVQLRGARGLSLVGRCWQTVGGQHLSRCQEATMHLQGKQLYTYSRVLTECHW